jgi:hypothetical protein
MIEGMKMKHIGFQDFFRYCIGTMTFRMVGVVMIVIAMGIVATSGNGGEAHEFLIILLCSGVAGLICGFGAAAAALHFDNSRNKRTNA